MQYKFVNTIIPSVVACKILYMPYIVTNIFDFSTGATISELGQMQLIDCLTQTVGANFIAFTKLKE